MQVITIFVILIFSYLFNNTVLYPRIRKQRKQLKGIRRVCMGVAILNKAPSVKITWGRSEPNIRGRIPDIGYAYVTIQLTYPAGIGTSLLS